MVQALVVKHFFKFKKRAHFPLFDLLKPSFHMAFKLKQKKIYSNTLYYNNIQQNLTIYYYHIKLQGIVYYLRTVEHTVPGKPFVYIDEEH